MEMNIIYQVIGIVWLAVVAGFAIMRWIDHAFMKSETHDEMKGYHWIACDYADRTAKHQRQLMQSTLDRTKNMSIEMIRQINKSIFDMAKEYEDD